MYAGKSWLGLLILGLLWCSEVQGNEVRIKADIGTASEWVLDERLFGRFFELHGTDAYPGLYEQYLVNTSFEKWYVKDEDSPTPLRDVKELIVFEDVDRYRGIAHPWEPIGGRPGKHMKLSKEAFNTDRSQWIYNEGPALKAGVSQKIGLPDYRTSKYRFSVHAKAPQGATELYVRLRTQEGELLDELRFTLSSDWEKYAGELELGGVRSKAKINNRHGIYQLRLVVPPDSEALLDHATLFPEDSVEGIWNPETLANLHDVGVTVIRWPGGNFASGYRWSDGVGPMEQRPTRPNLAWGGPEPNFLGTDEFLRLCESEGFTPLICVGFDYATPEEAAAWVEYCNGGVETRFGSIRAKNGHPVPYGVKMWQIGNEVYGHYQTGHTSAEDYASRFNDYVHAMREKDPNIEIMAMGRDPGYHWNDDNQWNRACFRLIGSKMQYLDIHRYVRGLRNKRELRAWNLERLAEIYLSFSTQYEDIIQSIRQVAKEEGVEDVDLAVTEWAQYLTLKHPDLPHKFSQANAVFYAGMMNAFFKHGDFVRISCSHDFSVFAQNRSFWNVPVLPRSHVARLYRDAAGQQVVPAEVASPVFDLDRDIPQMNQTDSIPLVDAVVLKEPRTGKVTLFIVNRSVRESHQARVELDAMKTLLSWEAQTFQPRGNPFRAANWSDPQPFEIQETNGKLKQGRLSCNLPACSVVKLTIESH